ncbi:putative peptidase [metagenome]
MTDEEIIIKKTNPKPPSKECTPDNDTNVYAKAPIGQPDYLPVHFLEDGVKAQNPVARVVIPITNTRIKYGTGFLVSPTLFLTNNHVLLFPNEASTASFQFNYQDDSQGNPLPLDSFSAIAANPVIATSPDNDLDYTLVRLAPNSSINPGDKYGFIQLSPISIAVNQPCNIIQHPEHRRKEVVLQNNQLTNIYPKVIRYKTDTETGSSGAPVFDNNWKLISLHHSKGDRDTNGTWLNNEGIRINELIADLKQKLSPTRVGRSILSELKIL